MVEPSFSALFSGSKVSVIGRLVEFPCDIVPFVAVLILSTIKKKLLNDLSEKLSLFFVPVTIFCQLLIDQLDGFIFEDTLTLVQEDLSKEIP